MSLKLNDFMTPVGESFLEKEVEVYGEEVGEYGEEVGEYGLEDGDQDAYLLPVGVGWRFVNSTSFARGF